MEILDVVDENNNNLTGKTEDREIIHEKGLWHREVAAWIMNKKGEVLLQKRAATKKQNPNKWGLTAGHIDSGEKIEDVMHREALEELGVNIKDFSLLEVIKVKDEHLNNGSKNNHFVYIFFTKVDYNLKDYTIQKEELSELKYITLEELEEIVNHKDDNYTFSKRDYMKQILEYLYKRRNEILNQ